MTNTTYLLKKDLNFTELENIKLEKRARITSEMTTENTDKVIDLIVQKKGISETLTLALITGLAQNGGTNRSAGNAATFTLGEHTLSAQELNNIVKKIEPKGTIRQLARSLSQEIAEIAQNLGLEGDLSNQMRLDYPDLTSEEAVWCSNFQTTNSQCPERVREWLVENYRGRFNR